MPFIDKIDIVDAYVGKPDYKFEYDFRNKTKTQLQTDWWDISNTSTTSFNSTYWICAVWTNSVNTISRSIWTAFTNAKKIKFWMTWYYSTVNSYELWLSWRSYNGSTTNRFWIGTDKWYNWTAYMYYTKSNSLIAWPNISTWWLDYSIEYDLVNKTITYVVNWTTYTATLTDTDVSNIKLNNMIYFYYWQNWSTTVVYWTTVSLTIEY